jgi:phospholipase C
MRFLAQGSLHLKRALALALALQLTGCGGTSTTPSQPSGSTATPIKHVIIVIGENHSFDNLFATYQPGDKSQQV